MSQLLLPRTIAEQINRRSARQAYERAAHLGRVYRFTWLRFWADGGMIYIYDEKKGGLTSISPDTAEARASALGEESRVEEKYGDERRDLENAANDLRECAARARAQGSPLDPGYQNWLSRHLPRNTSIPTPGSPPPPVPDRVLRPGEVRTRGGIILP